MFITSREFRGLARGEQRWEAYKAAPIADTYSGLIYLDIWLSANKDFNSYVTQGILVDPPISNISLIAVGWKWDFEIASKINVFVCCIKGMVTF